MVGPKGEVEGEENGEGGINAILYIPSTYCTVPANQIINSFVLRWIIHQHCGFVVRKEKQAQHGVFTGSHNSGLRRL